MEAVHRMQIRHEWKMTGPRVHVTEVEKAIAAARALAGDDADLWVQGDETKIVVFTSWDEDE